MAVATAWSCVKLLADGIATIALKGPQAVADGSRIPAGPDQRLAQLLARPWPGATAIDLVSMMVTHLCLFGEVWMPKFVQEGSIVTLGPLLHPDRCQIFIRGTNVSYALDGREEYGPPDIVFIRGLLDSIGLRGMSPVAASPERVRAQRSAARIQPSPVLQRRLAPVRCAHSRRRRQPSRDTEPPRRLAQPVLRGRRHQEHASRRGAPRRNEVHADHVLNGRPGVPGIPRVQRPRDRRDLRTAGMGGQRRQRLEPDLREHDPAGPVPDPAPFRPITSRIESALSADPTLCPGNTFCAFDFSELLRGIPAERADFYVKALGTDKEPGWMSRAEIRAAENLPPEPAPAGADARRRTTMTVPSVGQPIETINPMIQMARQYILDAPDAEDGAEMPAILDNLKELVATSTTPPTTPRTSHPPTRCQPRPQAARQRTAHARKPGRSRPDQARPLSSDKRIRGLVPFGIESRDMGGWNEIIDNTAFHKTDFTELRAVIDHKGAPLARYPRTLQLENRSDGLAWSLDPPNHAKTSSKRSNAAT